MLFDSPLIADAAYSWVGILLLDAEIETAATSTGTPGVELCLSTTAGLSSEPNFRALGCGVRTSQRSLASCDADSALQWQLVIVLDCFPWGFNCSLIFWNSRSPLLVHCE